MEFESRALRKLCSVVPDTKYAVAVSGGIDSIVLMRLVAKLHSTGRPGIPVVLTVNHGFRPEAIHEVDFVNTQASLFNLECKTLSWNHPITKKTQDTARNIRYKLIEQWCSAHAVQFLLTAHTKNDQAETILIRLERGSGLDGLTGMREHSKLGAITILRPLLDFTRREIQDYAAKTKQLWIEDSSNENPKYKRTFYRYLINENSNPEILINRLCVTAMHMQKALHCVLHYVLHAVDTCLEFSPWGCVVIKTEDLSKVHEEIARRLLLLVLMAIGNKALKPRYKSFSTAFEKIRNNENFSSFTIHGCKIVSGPNTCVTIVREVQRIASKIPVVSPFIMHWDGRFELTLSKKPEENLPPQSNVRNMPSPEVECRTSRSESENGNATRSDETLYVTPLETRPLPEYLKHISKDITSGLPILIKGDKVLAYPMQNNDTCRIPEFKIARVLLRDRIVNLICTQLDL